MLFLKIYLLGGLIVHKVVWEILKRRRGDNSDNAVGNNGRHSLTVQVVKAVKVAILCGIAAQTLLPDVLPLTTQPFALRLAGLLIYTLGLLTAIRGRLQLGSNWSDIETAKILREHAVVARGPYRFIRHPIYVGDLLLLVGLELSLNSLLVLGILLLAPVVLWQAIREEAKLVRALPGYEAYRAQTKRFIPFVV